MKVQKLIFFTACGMKYPVLGKIEVKLNINDFILYKEMNVIEN